MKSAVHGFAIVLAAVTIAHAGASAERDVATRMRDGVVLRADVFRPEGPGPFPVLVYRTPYDRRRAPADYTTIGKAIDRGYAVVVQDVRGRYGSGGEFVPYRHEGRDGYDTIEWAAAQAWSDGRIGTFGLSYPGAVQWLAALESPPHLLALVPAMTFSTASNFVYSGGVFDMSWTSWIWSNIAPDVRARKNLAGPRTDDEADAEWERIGDRVKRRLPLSDVPELRAVAPYLFEWMTTPPGDPAWDFLEVRGKYARVKAAVLNLSGWYDEAYGPEGAVTNYLGLQASRSAEARRGAGLRCAFAERSRIRATSLRSGVTPAIPLLHDDARTQLVIGPWIHGSVTMNDAARQSRSGERPFGGKAAVDYDELILRFMDHHVRGVDNGVSSEKAVRLFVMGENVWREDDRFPPTGARTRDLFLRGRSGSGHGALIERPPTADEPPTAFVSDPLDPVSDPFAPRAGAHDYRDLPTRKDLLVFETEPFEADLRVLGPITADIYLSTDARDTDLWSRVYDVGPDGTAWNLMAPGLDVVRASYRSGGPTRELLEPGRVYPLRFRSLLTGNLFARGHRLRVIVSATFFPHFSRNLHTGELETVSKAARKATIHVHHSQRYPSKLALTIVP